MTPIVLLLSCIPSPAQVASCQASQKAWIDQMKPERVACVDYPTGPQCDVVAAGHRYQLGCSLSVPGNVYVVPVKESEGYRR